MWTAATPGMSHAVLMTSLSWPSRGCAAAACDVHFLYVLVLDGAEFPAERFMFLHSRTVVRLMAGAAKSPELHFSRNLLLMKLKLNPSLEKSWAAFNIAHRLAKSCLRIRRGMHSNVRVAKASNVAGARMKIVVELSKVTHDLRPHAELSKPAIGPQRQQ